VGLPSKLCIGHGSRYVPRTRASRTITGCTILRIIILMGVLGASRILTACSSIEGYPSDPENTSAVLSSLSEYFDPSWDAQYTNASDPESRRRLRDIIVLNRMRAYDIEFDNFEKGLYSEANTVTTVGGLTTIVAGAVGATAGGLVTKAALNAGSSAVTGAQNGISKELYYQRTLPALISQIDADRATAKVAILKGLKLPDSSYSLAEAYVDLESLKNAGGIPRAISSVTQSASTNAQVADAELESLRDVTFTAASSISAIEKWLHAGGPLGPGNQNWKKLTLWMKNDQVHPVLANIPVATFLSSSQFESDRQRAIKEIPVK
jgi:hypothetical protein